MGGLRLGECEALRYTVMEEEGQVFSLSNDTESAVASTFQQVDWPGLASSVDRCAPSLRHNDQPPADDRRRGENTYKGLSLECGSEMRVSLGHLLLDFEVGTVREKLAL